MSIHQQIKILCIKNNISLSELARKLGISPSALFQKLRRGSVSLDDCCRIAEVLGCQFNARFILDNNEIVWAEHYGDFADDQS